MQVVQDVSGERHAEFSKIREGIYNAPHDFFIKAGSLYEPIDDELLRECGGITTSFSLTRVYEALQSSKHCDHIWQVLKPLYSLSRDTDLQTLCKIMPGVYQVPSDVVVIRMYGSPVIGGISYRLISRKLHSECHCLFALPRKEQQLMLAEIYGGLWIHYKGQTEKLRILLEMKVLMRGWLQDTTFLNTEEGMLTMLVLKLGIYFDSQVIANLIGVKVKIGKYILTHVRPYGIEDWSAKFQLEEKPDHWLNAVATLDKLVHALPSANATSNGVKP